MLDDGSAGRRAGGAWQTDRYFARPQRLRNRYGALGGKRHERIDFGLERVGGRRIGWRLHRGDYWRVHVVTLGLGWRVVDWRLFFDDGEWSPVLTRGLALQEPIDRIGCLSQGLNVH